MIYSLVLAESWFHKNEKSIKRLVYEHLRAIGVFWDQNSELNDLFCLD